MPMVRIASYHRSPDYAYASRPNAKLVHSVSYQVNWEQTESPPRTTTVYYINPNSLWITASYSSFCYAPALLKLPFVSRFTSGARNHYSKILLNPLVKSSFENCVQSFISTHKLTNSEKYDTASNTIMIENISSEGTPLRPTRIKVPKSAN